MRVRGLVGGGVDEDGEVGEEAVLEGVAEEDVVGEGVVLGGGGLGVDAVVLVEGEGLGVGAVGLEQLDRVDQALVEEELPDVVRLAVRQVRVVRQHRRVLRAHQVDVRRPSRVVPREHRVELRHAVFVGWLDTAPVDRVETALAHRGDARVDARGVAVPDVDQHVGDRFAGVDIYELQVKVEGNSSLAIGQVSL